MNRMNENEIYSNIKKKRRESNENKVIEEKERKREGRSF